jgi:hypothetical protein
MVPIIYPTLDSSASHSPAEMARVEQAFYEQYANATVSRTAMQWLVPITLLLTLLAAMFIPGSSYAHQASKDEHHTGTAVRKKTSPRSINHDKFAGSPLTVFIDGPTGFVFVYTAEGWKFVRGIGDQKL